LKTNTQLAAETRRWLRGLNDADLREECRDQFEEWFTEEEMDEEQVRVTLRFWRRVLGGSCR
jgi:ferric-dicitrate binding protein FerR (iron transport regulator)